MGWLGPDGAGPVTGARWSAGATWADAGDPQPGDSDWEDPDDWPHAYGDPLTLRVYVGGIDLTERTKAASWGLGNQDLFGGLSPSSANVVLRGPGGAGAGDRVVITTETDVLWVGRVESSNEGHAIEETTLTLSCADDVSRATPAEWDGPLGGDPLNMLAALLSRAGIAPGARWTHAASPYVLDHTGEVFSPIAKSGAVMSLVGEVAELCNAAVAVTPGAVNVCLRSLCTVEPPTIEGVRDRAGSWSLSRNVTSVFNDWLVWVGVTGAFEPYGLDVYSVFIDGLGPLWEASRRAYGHRPKVIDSDGWYVQFRPQTGYLWTPTVERTAEPLRTFESAHLIEGPADDEHRLMPLLDVVSEGADSFLVTSVAHAVTPAEWRTTLHGFQVEDIS